MPKGEEIALFLALLPSPRTAWAAALVVAAAALHRAMSVTLHTDSGDLKISSFTIKMLNRPRSGYPACCDGSAIGRGNGATLNAMGRYNRLACASGANDLQKRRMSCKRFF